MNVHLSQVDSRLYHRQVKKAAHFRSSSHTHTHSQSHRRTIPLSFNLKIPDTHYPDLYPKPLPITHQSFPNLTSISGCNKVYTFLPTAVCQFTMSRRPVNPSRRLVDNGNISFGASLRSKSRSSPLLSIGLVLLGAFFFIAYSYSSSGRTEGINVRSKSEGGVSCTLDLHQALLLLKKTYGDSMNKVLHVGPDTCSVVAKLLKDKETEAWGVEPYDVDEADNQCHSLVRKGFVRVADLKFSLPYRPKSFSLVLVSDALDYLTPRYLNNTLPELARVASDGLVIFTGYPGQSRAKVNELSKFGKAKAKLRSSTWWIRYFVQKGLEENDAATKKFEQASAKLSYKPACQVFHLKAYQ